MPELPEVQATVDYLRERVEGCTITRGLVSWKRSVAPSDSLYFERTIAGATIDELFRRGKYIGMRLQTDRQLFLFVHLRMSGSLDVISTTSSLDTHDRVCLELDSGKSIRFNDVRKFGRMQLCEDPAEIVGGLGVEPLSPEFTPALLSDLLTTRNGRIKPLLLNQAIIAGLGNIYVDEVLWKTKIHPLTPAPALSPPDISNLHHAIQSTLTEAIQKLGTDFGDGVVDGGMYRPRVYGRDGKKCLRCRHEVITRIVVAQRGTHICPACQLRKRRRSRSTTVRNCSQHQPKSKT